MAGTNQMKLSAYDQVSQEMQSHDEDQIFWWSMFGQSFATLLQTNRYRDAEQLYYLRWFKKWILRSLGPRPIDGNPHYHASLTYDGSPLEFSINWKEKKANQVVRFTTEPCSRETGTSVDPINQLAALHLFKAMAEDVPSLDLTRFNVFLEGTHVPDDVSTEVLSKIPAGHPRIRVVVAYDLEQGAIMPKSYFNPVPAAIHRNIPPATVALDAIRKCKGPNGCYDPSIELLRSYFKSREAPDGPMVFLLANDCVADSPKSRAKVYVTCPVTTFAAALDGYSLDGRLSGPEISAGLEAVCQLWSHLFGLDSSDEDFKTKEVLPAGSRCTFVYEMRPSQEQGGNIETKMHMPGTWWGETDAKVSGALSKWFEKHGHHDFATRYQKDLASTL